MTDPIDILAIARDAEYRAHEAFRRAQMMNAYQCPESAGRVLNVALARIEMASTDMRRVQRLIMQLDAECSA